MTGGWPPLATRLCPSERLHVRRWPLAPRVGYIVRRGAVNALVLASQPVAPETFHYQGDGVQITGDRWASGGPGDIVVLLHGGGQTRRSWDRTAERLAAGGSTAVTLDARGHGDSEWHPDQDYSIDGFVGDLLAFVATLDRTPVLVGASLGGITSLVAAGEHPGLAKGLVLVDVVVSVERAGVDRIKNFLTAHHDGFARLEDVAAAIEAYNPVRRRSRNLNGLRKNVRQRDDGRWYWHWDPEFISNDDEPQRRADRQRLRRAASGITIPTLAGDDNDVFATRLAEFLSNLDAKESPVRP